jgi:hypothetical protein
MRRARGAAAWRRVWADRRVAEKKMMIWRRRTVAVYIERYG